MALQAFGAGSSSIGSGVRANLTTLDDAFVDFGATVSSSDSIAIHGSGSIHSVNIQGTVMGNHSAVSLGDDPSDSDNHVLIGSSGYAGNYNGQSWTIVLHSSDSTIDNRGTIWGGGGRGVSIGGASGTTLVTNSGTIEASAIGIIHASMNDVLVINNSGLIKSSILAINGSSGIEQVTNSGQIIGGILLKDGDDIYSGAAGRLAGHVAGGDGADTIIGGIDNDLFSGGTGNDILNGGLGNDLLDGGLDSDTMFGGAGNDSFVVDSAGDTVSESGGNGTDLVQSSISFNLANTARAIGAVENLTLVNVATALNGTGNALNNVMTGNSFANVFNGQNGNDRLIGDAGNDTLNGGLGNDNLNGGIGSDRLFGSAGVDALTGGANNDFFVFNTALSASTNRDIIYDFSHVDDTFHLENAIFTKLGAGVHALNPAFFRTGAAALDANDYIVYNRSTGALSYDPNGNAAGGAIAFAVLTNKPVLAANDFVVI